MVTKMSTKHQVVIPKKAREEAKLKSGQTFTVEVVKGGVMLRPLNINTWKDLGGIAQGMFDKDGGPMEYLRKERESWDW
jgi:AbrB family looped-hinge helix DNA binding protein